MIEQVCRQLAGTNWRLIYAGYKGSAYRPTALASSNRGEYLVCANISFNATSSGLD